MHLLRKRQFWMVAGVAILLLAGVAAYLLPPWPSGMNWLFDGLAFSLTFLGGLAIISQLVMPVQTRRQRHRAFNHFMHFVSGQAGPVIFVRNGRLVGRQDELKRYGAGVAVIDSVSAIVVERTSAPRAWLVQSEGDEAGEPRRSGPPLVRAAGPGLAFIAPGERIVAALDLRRQSRSSSIQGLTRDGIEISASVSVTFGLDPDPNRRQPAKTEEAPLHRRPERPPQPADPFHPSSAFRAVYGIALGEKQAVEWTDLPLIVAVERFRDVLSTYYLDELFPPIDSDAYPFDEFARRVRLAVQEAPVLRERGLVVYSVGVGGVRLPPEVVNQRIRSWQARWQKAIIQQEGALRREAILVRGRQYADLQEWLFKDIQALLGGTQDPVARQALTMMLVKAIRRAAADPRMRRRLPAETLRTIDGLEEWPQ